MSSAQLLYGRRDNELVHVDDVERGLACQCSCPVCGRALVARKGEVLSHFFAHAADEVNCNPSPESLVHSYAKQQIGKLRQLNLPGFDVHARHETRDGQVQELFWRHQPTYSVTTKEGEVESTRFAGVKPDVMFFAEKGWIAVEVFYRHAVPPEKAHKLAEMGLGAVEVNLSDLPTNASSAMMDAALKQPARWSWLNERCREAEEYHLVQKLEYASKVLIPALPPAQPKISGSTVPARLMRDASSMIYQRKAQLLTDELRRTPAHLRAQRIRPLERELRLALHCLQIGVVPAKLPVNLMQSVTRQSVFGVPAILWQTGLFSKFCMTGHEFTAKEAALWLRAVFPGLDGIFGTAETANGFNDYSEATHNFFNYLGAQGLLRVIRGKHRWDATFAPVASTKDQVQARLLELPPAIAT